MNKAYSICWNLTLVQIMCSSFWILGYVCRDFDVIYVLDHGRVELFRGLFFNSRCKYLGSWNKIRSFFFLTRGKLILKPKCSVYFICNQLHWRFLLLINVWWYGCYLLLATSDHNEYHKMVKKHILANVLGVNAQVVYKTFWLPHHYLSI